MARRWTRLSALPLLAAVLCAPLPAAAQLASEFAVPTAASGPLRITLGPDGALWFTESQANKIGRISTSGAFTEFTIPSANSAVRVITAGPDGALWFTESSFAAPKIGRITTTGTFTEFPLGLFTKPVDIVTGPDGNLWFTESSASMIGRITPAGVVATFPVANAVGIASGPDGALWFTEPGPNKIGRMNTSGAVTNEFAVPTAGAKPEDINVGPDGALWFTETNVNQIGRIATGGTITEYPVASGGVNNLKVIAPGPDGNLWFTETANNIARITTAGVISEFPLSAAASAPVGIVAGPDGTMWFTELNGNKIGRLSTPALTVAVAGSGAGQVTSTPAGISCGNGGSQCTKPFIVNTAVTLTASAASGSVFTGWSGACTGTGPCSVTLTADTSATANFAPTNTPASLSVTLAGSGSGTVTSTPSGINCGTTCTANFPVGSPVTLTAAAANGSTFAGWAGGGCVGTQPCTLIPAGNTAVTAVFFANNAPVDVLMAAVLPGSRSVQAGTPATAFATINNAGPFNATTCFISPSTVVPASFAFQTTNPATNAVTGTANTPVDIPQGVSQSFVIALTPTAAFAPTEVAFNFLCGSTSIGANSLTGINTLNLSASASPVPDIVALVASGDPGYVDIPGTNGTGVFAVATINLGTAATITAKADTGAANLPVGLMVCQTDPQSGACLAPPAASASTSIAPNATPTFGVFVGGTGPVADLPGSNRVFMRFTDSGGTLRGATSVAVRTK